MESNYTPIKVLKRKKHVRKDTNLTQFFQKIGKEATLTNIFYEVTITMISKADTEITKKKIKDLSIP